MQASWSITPLNALRLPFGQRMRGDGPPYWREGRSNKPQISAAEARRQRGLLIKLLDHSRENDRGHADDLVRRLEACTRSNPCGGGACQVCWRALRRLVVHASWHLFRDLDTNLYVTGICGPKMVAHGRLHEADPFAAVERRLTAIASERRVRIFGGLDISSNEHRQGRFEPHYMPHTHHLVSADAFTKHSTAWDERFPDHDFVAKPIETKVYDGRRRAIAYCFHPIIERRDSEAAYFAANSTWKRANTRDKPLRRPQRLELALMLDRVGIEARVMMYGYELVTNGDDIWMTPVDRPRADELLAERQQRRAAQQLEYHRRERERDAQDRSPRFHL